MQELPRDIKSHIFDYLLPEDMIIIKSDVVFNRKLCKYYAGCGHIGLLKLIWNKIYCHNKSLCSKAAAGGHLETLKWLLANNCQYDPIITHSAARSGHLFIL